MKLNIMKMNIVSRKKGYASLEVIFMSFIGFTLVLAILSTALNKKVFIEKEIKPYKEKLYNYKEQVKEDSEKYIFLENILYLINNKKISTETLEGLENKKIDEKKFDNNKNLDFLNYERINLDNKEHFHKLNLLESENHKFKLYFNGNENMFILEENLDEDDIKIYYYDYRLIEGDIYLKERRNFNVK